jgi:hypothetical protein
MIAMNRMSRNVVSASTVYEPPNAVEPVLPTTITTTAVAASPMRAVPIAASLRPGRTRSTRRIAAAVSTAAIRGAIE